MKICECHRDNLLQRFKDLGMYDLICDASEEKTASTINYIMGHSDETEGGYDPLIAVQLMIFTVFKDTLKEDVVLPMDLCPLCIMEEFEEGTAKDWIDGSTGDQLKLTRELGMMPALQ